MSNEPTTPQIDKTDDERLGLPSGSTFYIDVNCPGRRQLWEQILSSVGPIKPEEPGEPALRGIRIHLARETGNVLNLSEDELESYNKGIKMEGEAVREWIDSLGGSAKVEKFEEGTRELRLWFPNPETLVPEASAKLDVHFIAQMAGPDTVTSVRPRIYLIDWKSGTAIYAGKASQNWQLKLGAVLLLKEFDAHSVRVGLNKFDAFHPVVDIHDYDREQLVEAEREIWYRIQQTKIPGAPRHCGSWCAFCPCKAYCPEGGAFALLPGTAARWDMKRVATKKDEEEVEALVKQLSPAECAYVFRMSSTVVRIIDATKARLRGMSDTDLANLGLKATPGRLDRDIPPEKVIEAVSALAGAGMTDNEIWVSLDVNLTRVAEKLRAKYPEKLTSEEKAKEFARKLLADLIAETRGEKIIREL